MPKRKNKEAIIASLEKQLKKMQEQIDAFQPENDRSSAENSETESEISGDGGPGIDLITINQEDEIEKDADKENKVENANLCDDDNTKQTAETKPGDDKELSEEVLKVLGEDPLASKAIEISLHASLSLRWKHWAINGVAKQEMDDTLSKYARQEGLETPKLNPEIAVNLGESAIKRDNFISENQKSVGSAITAVGSALSMLLEEDESIDKLCFIERLSDAVKILTDLLFRLSESRKAFILPGLSKQSKDILTATKLDEFLFGKNLAERLKEARALDKLSQNMKQQFKTSTYNKNNLNGKSLPGKKTFYNQAGTAGPSNQNRPRLFFKSKQQYFNPKAQTQRNSKFRGNRGK